MRTSESIKQIAPALLKAQKEIKCVDRDKVNKGFNSVYASLGAVIEAVKEPLNESGIIFLQSLSESTPGVLCCTTRLLHESGEWIEDTATIPLAKIDPQGYGSAATYIRRYSLSAIVGLHQDDDDANAAILLADQMNKPPVKKGYQAPKPVPKGLKADDVIWAIQACASMDELQSMVPQCEPFRGTPDYDRVRQAYSVKRDAIRAIENEITTQVI